MKTATIRTLVAHRPFRPLEVCLNNGDRYRIGSPEILLTDTDLVALDSDGDFVWVDTDAVAAIKPLRRRNGRAR